MIILNSNIEIKDLTVHFDNKNQSTKVISGINITFESNKVTGLIGESGSGKSVLGMSILRLLPKTAKITGNCNYKGKDLFNCKDEYIRDLRGKEISLIPQNPLESLNPVLKIKGQLVESFTVHNKKNKKLGIDKSEQLLKRFGFKNYKEIMKKYTFQMSGGMNQRIISVLGLMCNPRWIIADEPTKGLDAILRRQVYNLLKNILDEDKVSMILITHDILLAERLCDKIAVLYSGKIVEQGSVECIINNPKHPYTKGLINSLPNNGMLSISLRIDDRENGRDGCEFYSRCEYAEQRCKNEAPKEYITDDKSIVRCFIYDRS